MKAILRSFASESDYTDQLVEIDDDHDFSLGPYQDSVHFSVGSNQSILPLEFTEKAYRPWPTPWSDIAIRRLPKSTFDDLFWLRPDGVVQYLATT